MAHSVSYAKHLENVRVERERKLKEAKREMRLNELKMGIAKPKPSKLASVEISNDSLKF